MQGALPLLLPCLTAFAPYTAYPGSPVGLARPSPRFSAAPVASVQPFKRSAKFLSGQQGVTSERACHCGELPTPPRTEQLQRSDARFAAVPQVFPAGTMRRTSATRSATPMAAQSLARWA